MTEANGLIHHNDLFCHLFDAVTKSQGMAALIIGAKSNTVCGLLKSTFPAIKTTEDLPTPYVTPATVAYIHGLIINVGFEQPSPDDPSFGKPFAWQYPLDTADPGERVSPLVGGDHNDSPRAQDT